MGRQSRNTKQKKVLEFEISRFTSFFTAEELFDRVKSKNIGIATVYRFLKEMCNTEKIHSYLCDRKAIYSAHRNSHCHFTCEKCGNVKHITIDSIDFIKSKIAGDICHFQINISGICPRCR